MWFFLWRSELFFAFFFFLKKDSWAHFNPWTHLLCWPLLGSFLYPWLWTAPLWCTCDALWCSSLMLMEAELGWASWTLHLQLSIHLETVWLLGLQYFFCLLCSFRDSNCTGYRAWRLPQLTDSPSHGYLVSPPARTPPPQSLWPPSHMNMSLWLSPLPSRLKLYGFHLGH